jgi:hypothetical protein
MPTAIAVAMAIGTYQSSQGAREPSASGRAGVAAGKRTVTGSLPPRLVAQASATSGHDLSTVTVHSDGQAEALGTRAFARGDQLHFAAGSFQPDTREGRALVAHELGHVAQQREGMVAATEVRRGMAVNAAPALEDDADRRGDAIAQAFDLDEFSAFGAPPASGGAVAAHLGWTSVAPVGPASSGEVVQGFDLDEFSRFGLATAPAPGGGVVQAEDLPPLASAAPNSATASSAAVPPEVLARVGLEFVHDEDTNARRYRIDPGGVFTIVASPFPAEDGAHLRPTDTGKLHTAWSTLADYVVAEAASLAPTEMAPDGAVAGAVDLADRGSAAPVPGTDPGAEPATSSGGLVRGLVDTIAGGLDVVLDAGRSLVGGATAIIDAALAVLTGAPPSAVPAADAPVAEAPPTASAGATPDAPSPVREPDAPPPTLGQVPGAPAVPDGAPAVPTTTAMTSSVGADGDNLRDDVILVQARLRELGYPVNTTGVPDDATIYAIKMFQAARTASAVAPGQRGSLVGWIDGRIDAGGPSAAALFSSAAPRFKTIAPGAVKPVGSSPQAAYNASTGEARAIWDRLMAVWARVSPYLVGDAYMSSGYRSEADQVRVIENFYTKPQDQGGYREALIANHGEADWSTYVGLTDDASVEIKRQRVKALGQDVAAPGTSPHQSGRAIDIGGSQEAEQILALLRFAIEVDATLVSSLLYEKNTCVHIEFDP